MNREGVVVKLHLYSKHIVLTGHLWLKIAKSSDGAFVCHISRSEFVILAFIQEGEVVRNTKAPLSLGASLTMADPSSGVLASG